MNYLDNIIKPKQANQNTLVVFGSILILISFLDVVILSVFDVNLTGSSKGISFFLPLLLGFIGMYYIRFDHTNFPLINRFNKSLNIDWLNSIFTLLSIFFLLKFVHTD